MGAVKDEAKKLIDSLPEHASWDDIMYEFYVKKKLAKALKEADKYECMPHENVKEQLSSKS